MAFSYRPAQRQRRIRADLILTLAMVLTAAGTLILAVLPSRASELASLPGYPPGTIVINQHQRSLYLVTAEGEALKYPVAVGRMGKQWHGVVTVDGKYVEPAWAPPREVKRAEPWLPSYVAGGSPYNPMGARALTLSGDQYAIHGTNRPGSIGTAASYGCIRMYNRDIIDLYDRVAVGTPVVVLQ
jgi:lipoprotein-anchoring transpeptidase ErfK/SrfK